MQDVLRVAGRESDYFQMNHDTTKDRLGANGLVNKGQVTFMGSKKPKYDFTQTGYSCFSPLSVMKSTGGKMSTISNDLYATRW